MKKIEKLKEEGNVFFREKDYKNAGEKYLLAIEKCNKEKNKDILSKLYSNLCVCKMNLKELSEALTCAEKCISFNQLWSKGYLRKMTCLSKMGEEQKIKIVNIMYTFLKVFPREGEKEFTKSEVKWIEELQIHSGYYQHPEILQEVFNLNAKEDKEKKGTVNIVCVDAMGRGHTKSVVEAVYNVDDKTRILVMNGIYRELVLFEKKELEIIGEDPLKTIIELKGYPKNVAKEEVREIDGTVLLKQSKVKFQNLTISNYLNNPQNSGVGIVGSSVAFVNCRIMCPTGIGIYFRKGSTCILQKTHVTRCEYGIMNSEKGRLTMSNSKISFCEKTGIAMNEGSVSTIKGSQFSNCKNQALIVLGKSSEMTMRKCKVSDNGSGENCKTAVLFSGGCKKILVDENEFMNNNFQAIQLKNCGAIITNNEFGLHQIAVGIQVSASAILKKNTFKNLGFGIWIYNNGKGKVHIEENEFLNTSIEVSKYPGDKDPIFVNQPDITVKEYSDVVQSLPRRRKIPKREEKKVNLKGERFSSNTSKIGINRVEKKEEKKLEPMEKEKKREKRNWKRDWLFKILIVVISNLFFLIYFVQNK